MYDLIGVLFCKDHTNSSPVFCFVSGELCVRRKQRCLMKHLGKAQPPWSINICVCACHLPCDLSPGASGSADRHLESRGSSDVRQDWTLLMLNFTGDLIISALRSVSHTSPRGVGGGVGLYAGKKWCCLAPHQDRMWS